MGVWGPAIFSSDIALDIKQEYQTLLAFGTPEEEAYQLVRDNYNPEPDDVEFWFAIASIQQKYGILLPEVKEKTLQCIAKGYDDLLWEDTDSKTMRAREKVRTKLESDLLAPQLPRKKVPKPYVEKPRWEVGDIILSKIVNCQRSDQWLTDKYVLYRVTRLERYELSQLRPKLAYGEYPFGALYNWIGDKPPATEILDSLSYYSHDNYYEGHKISTMGLGWIPKLEKFKLFRRGDKKNIPNVDDMDRNQSGSSVFGSVARSESHFRALYERFKA